MKLKLKLNTVCLPEKGELAMDPHPTAVYSAERSYCLFPLLCSLLLGLLLFRGVSCWANRPEHAVPASFPFGSSRTHIKFCRPHKWQFSHFEALSKALPKFAKLVARPVAARFIIAHKPKKGVVGKSCHIPAMHYALHTHCASFFGVGGMGIKRVLT
jgi:hypothetical protein